jgi:hypothetical protein
MANIAIMVIGPPQSTPDGGVLVAMTGATSTGVIAGMQLRVNFGRSTAQINADLLNQGMSALRDAGYVDNTGGADVIKLFGGAN